MNAFLHIPKTAGSAIGTAIQGTISIEGASPISVFGHEYNLGTWRDMGLRSVFAILLIG